MQRKNHHTESAEQRTFKERIYYYVMQGVCVALVLLGGVIGGCIGYWLKQFIVANLPIAAMFVGFTVFTLLTVIGALIGNRLGIKLLDS